jgi:HK97 family phage prohead protease
MKEAYQYKGCMVSTDRPMSFKDVDGRKGIITGYFAMFDSVDSDGDIIRKGSFTKTIREQGPSSTKPRIKHLMNHDPFQPLGVVYELKEDAIGLYYESKLGTHSLGVDFIEMVDSGLITENSIGYITKKYNQLKPWNEWKEGEAARELTELKLYEGSNLSAWGANWRTYNNGVKSEKTIDMLSKRIDLLIKSLRSGTFTDETFDTLEIELKQLQQAFIDLSKPEPHVQGTQESTEETQPEPKQVVKSRKWSELSQLIQI